MADSRFRCTVCGTPLQGNSAMCVTCYAKCHKRCPMCTYLSAGGQTRTLKAFKGGKQHCHYCNDERFVIVIPDE